MGARVKARLDELQWQQIDLVRKVGEITNAGDRPLTDKALSALINRNAVNCEWSDEIAEALGVNHRWLQRGTGPKLRADADKWPFGDRFSPGDIADLPDVERGRIMGYIERTLEDHRRSRTKRSAA